ncbi:MAG: hypothetical protein WC989_02205 [Micavibrio sp.]
MNENVFKTYTLEQLANIAFEPSEADIFMAQNAGLQDDALKKVREDLRRIYAQRAGGLPQP